MKIIITTFSFFLMGICPGLLAQTFTAVGNFGNSFGAASVNNAATVSFNELVGSRTYYPIFDKLTLTGNNVGHLYTFTQANDPDFNSMVAVLTDGVSEFVGCSLNLVPGGGGQSDWNSESRFFSQLPLGGNGIDFRGFKIDSIALRLDLLDISSPGTNPNGNGIWTDCSYSGQISVNYEPVPEPATKVLTAIFALLLGVFGKLPGAQQRNL